MQVCPVFARMLRMQCMDMVSVVEQFFLVYVVNMGIYDDDVFSRGSVMASISKLKQNNFVTISVCVTVCDHKNRNHGDVWLSCTSCHILIGRL